MEEQALPYPVPWTLHIPLSLMLNTTTSLNSEGLLFAAQARSLFGNGNVARGDQLIRPFRMGAFGIHFSRSRIPSTRRGGSR